jgi:GWxTD domain-containing protein
MRIQKIYRIILLFSFSVFGLWSCIATQTGKTNPIVYKYNFSSLYNPSESSLHPESFAYINSDTTALVFFKQSIAELQQNMNNPSTQQIKFNLKYILRDENNAAIVDSSSLSYSINLGESEDFVISYFKVNLPNRNKYKLILIVADLKENLGKRLLVDVDNSIDFAASSFFTEVFEESTTPLFNCFVNSNSKYRITSKVIGKDSITVDYYSFANYNIIPPYYLTYAQNEVAKLDSSFVYNLGDTIKFDKLGIYLFKSSAQNVTGLGLINAGNYFPEIMTPSKMLEPLGLITTSKEYEEIEKSDNLKLSIESFWLARSNNQKYAKEQIRVFYNRVKFANTFFTDDKEGWKTDRGNLYVLLGPPSVVNLSPTGEDWFYGENPDVAGVLFVFDKINNPTSNNSYRLRRDVSYQTIWTQSVSTWRDGRIFSITKN